MSLLAHVFLLNLSTAAAIAEILGATTILGGALYAGYQVYALRRQRQDLALTTALQTYFPVEAMSDLDIVYGLPDGCDPGKINGNKDKLRAANRVYVFAEYLGNLVYHRAIPLGAADLLTGGMLLTTWPKLEPWIRDKRTASGSPTPGEWHEWLVNQLREHGRGPRRKGAYELFSDWRP